MVKNALSYYRMLFVKKKMLSKVAHFRNLESRISFASKRTTKILIAYVQPTDILATASPQMVAQTRQTILGTPTDVCGYC